MVNSPLKKSQLSYETFIFILFLESVFVSYIVSSSEDIFSINIIYTVLFLVCMMLFAGFIILLHKKPLLYICDKGMPRMKFKVRSFGIKEISFIVFLTLEVILLFFYYQLNEIFLFFLIMFFDFMSDILLRELKNNNNWIIIASSQWAITRCILLFTYISRGFSFTWIYIIFSLYPIIIIIAYIDIDYLGFRAFIPDTYYIILVYGMESYIVFSAILIPMLIKFYYYVYQ